jgi:hypothetical protein
MTWNTVFLRAPLVCTKTVTVPTGPGQSEQREIPIDEPFYNTGGRVMDCIEVGQDGDDMLLVCRQDPAEIAKNKAGVTLGQTLAEVKRDYPALYSAFADGSDVPKVAFFGVE